METGAPLRALKPASLRTGGLSHTPLRERCFFRGGAPEKRAEFPRIRLDLDKMRIVSRLRARNSAKPASPPGGDGLG